METPPDSPAGPPPIRWQGVVLGLVGAVAVPIFQLVSKVIPQTVALPLHSALSLMAGAVFWLFLVAVGNTVVKRWRPAWALRPAEFVAIYAMTTAAAGIAAQDEAQQLFPMFQYPFRATQDEAMGPFRRFIPTWAVPQDPAIVEPYYAGNTTFWTSERVLAWAIPVLVWTLWLAALGLTMWAWNVLLRRRWLDHDRLSFPCVQLPMEVCRNAGFGGILSGKLFWWGFGLAALLESLNKLSQRFPNLPSLPLGYAATPTLEQLPQPWNALAPMYLAWDTLHLGICYLVPLDILFSAWFFYLLRKGLEVIGYARGWRDLGFDADGFPYARSQAAGAWIALFLILVWAERKHLAQVLWSALERGGHSLGDESEPGSYRWAGRALIGGTAILVAFSMALGMSPGLALVYAFFFWMLNVTMTRVYMQVGPPMLEMYFLDPQKTLTTLLGTAGQSPQSLTAFSLMYWINRTDRGHPMAHQMAAFCVNKPVGAAPRRLGKLVLLAFVIGGFVCLLTGLHWAYRVGEDQYAEGGWREAFAPLAVSRIREWTGTPKGPALRELGFMGAGFAATLGLARLSVSLPTLPLHPVGFAMALCFAVEYNWPAYLMVWLVKGVMIRYGGLRLYLRYLPFAFGLVLGGFVVPVLWGFVAWWLEWYK